MNMSKGRRNLFLFPGFLGRRKKSFFILSIEGCLFLIRKRGRIKKGSGAKIHYSKLLTLTTLITDVPKENTICFFHSNELNAYSLQRKITEASAILPF